MIHEVPRMWLALRRTSKPTGTTGAEPSRDGAGDRERYGRARKPTVIAATCGAVLLAVWFGIDWLSPANRWARQLRSGTVEQRRQAVDMLGRFPSVDRQAAIPALTEALGDEDEQVAANAAGLLGGAISAASTGRDPARGPQGGRGRDRRLEGSQGPRPGLGGRADWASPHPASDQSGPTWPRTVPVH